MSLNPIKILGEEKQREAVQWLIDNAGMSAGYAPVHLINVINGLKKPVEGLVEAIPELKEYVKEEEVKEEVRPAEEVKPVEEVKEEPKKKGRKPKAEAAPEAEKGGE